GTKPEIEVNPYAVKVMAEIGIDISHHVSESIKKYLSLDFDVVATVCDNVRESCPLFTGEFIHMIHYGFNDPAKAIGNHHKIITVYRQVRDEIGAWVEKLNKDYM
ncbi:MAG: arsenate reductase ArsC, partial [Candidatus Marinimicrobia bacterium]|nr:arsenate reductase ArsC [Candidatus Neomarinimicrobiota bacterium]